MLSKPKPLSKEQKMETPTLELGQTTPTKVQVIEASTANQGSKHEQAAKVEVQSTEVVKHDNPDKTSAAKEAAAQDIVKSVKSLSPAEHLKALGKTAKPKGRPAKKAKAKAAPKAKSKAKKSKEQNKVNTSRHKRKVEEEPEVDEDQEAEEEEEAVHDPEVEVTDSGASSSKAPKETKRGKAAAKSKSKAVKAKGSKAKVAEAESKKGPASTNKTKKEKSTDSKQEDCKKGKRANANSSKGSKDKEECSRSKKQPKTDKTAPAKPELTEAQIEKTKLLSRKSCAYKKARKIALDNGKSLEEAKAAASKATRLYIYIHMCTRTGIPVKFFHLSVCVCVAFALDCPSFTELMIFTFN